MPNNKIKRILYVTTTLSKNWGGGEPIVAKETIKSLKDIGYDVVETFYKSKLGDLFTRLFNEWRKTSDLSDSFYFSYLYYKRIIRREKPEIIIAQYDYDSSIIKAAYDEKKKIIIYVHIWWPTCPKITRLDYLGKICKGFTNNNCKVCLLKSTKPKSIKGKLFKYNLLLLTNNRIQKKMKKRIDLLNRDNVTVVVLSQYMKDYLVTNGVSEGKIKIVPNGVSYNEFNSKNKSREKIVCYLGGESYTKGFQIFLKVAEIVKKRYSDIQFVATGNYENKPAFVNFVGLLDRDKVMSLYTRSRCTVMPSIWDEPFPRVVLESMAAGTPVVAFDVGILNNIIHNGEGGFVVPLMAIDEMADKIIKITNDDQLFSRLSENARRIVLEEFKEDKRVALLNEIIKLNINSSD